MGEEAVVAVKVKGDRSPRNKDMEADAAVRFEDIEVHV